MTREEEASARSLATEAEEQGARAIDRAAHDTDEVCWWCAGATVKRHCKIVCTNCGFIRDCSDP